MTGSVSHEATDALNKNIAVRHESGRSIIGAGPALFCLVLALGAAVFPTLELWREPYLRGTDAYYYALQADSWHRSGQVRIPDSSPLHPLIGCFIKAGLSPEKAVNLWLGLSLGLFSAAFYLLWLSAANRFGPLAGRPLPTLIILLWPLLSPSVFFCALEFPKTFSFAIAFTLALAAARHGSRLGLVTLGMMLLACFLHKMALVYTAALLVGLLCFWLKFPKRLIGRFTPGAVRFKAAALVLIAVSVLLLLSQVDPHRFSGRRMVPGAAALFLEPNLPLAIKLELMAAGFTLVWLCLKNRFKGRGTIFALCLAGPAFMPAFGPEPFSLGQRLGLMLPMTTALAAVFLLPPQTASVSTNSVVPPKTIWKPSKYALLIILTLVGSLARLEYSYPSRLSRSYVEYERLTDFLASRDIPMLIVNRDFHFFYKFRTGREAFSYEPENHWPKERIWRLAYGVNPTRTFHKLIRQLSA